MSGEPGVLWDVQRVKTVSTKIGSGKTPAGGGESYQDSGVVFLRSQNVHFDGLRLDDVAYIDHETHREMRASQVRDGDVLLNITGASLGRVTHVPPGFGQANVNQHVCIVRPSADVDSRFLARALSALKVQEQILALQVGGNRDGLNFEQVGNLKLALPSLDEQRCISDFLDEETCRVARVADTYARLREALATRRWSLFRHLVAEVDAPLTPLRRAFEFITDGPFGSAFSSSDYSAGGAAVVRLGNIGFGEYRHRDQVFVPLDLYRKFYRHKVRPGDLLIAGLGDVRNHAGRACVAPDLGPAIVKGKCFCVRVNRKVADPHFLSLLLSSPVGEHSMATRGSTRSMINLEVVKSAIVPLPALTDQMRIAKQMDAADAGQQRAANAIARQEVLLSERQQSLMTAAVTGQIDVTTTRGVDA